jgi:hypothetical protein
MDMDMDMDRDTESGLLYITAATEHGSQVRSHFETNDDYEFFSLLNAHETCTLYGCDVNWWI